MEQLQKEELKQSSFGEFPDDWIEKPLGSIITLQRGHDLPDRLRNIGNIPVIGANGITGYHDTAKVKGPGVLIGRSGTLGKVYFIETDYWPLNTSLYVKQVHAGDPKFIYYLLHKIDYKRYNAGTTVQTLNRNLLHPIPVIMPKSIKEQQKIASILSKVDELIQKTDQVIEQTQKLKKGLMQRLLTKGIGHIMFRSSPLGSIPDSWEIVRLEDITTISTGSTPSTLVQEYYDGEIPFIRTAEIVNRIITDAMLHVSKRAVNECSMNIYPPNTVFLAMYGQGKTRGQSALLNIYATTSQNTAAIVVNEVKLDAVYLWQYLLFSYNRLRGEGNIGYISHLTLNFVKKLSIQLPPINEQKKIVLILSQIDNKIEYGIQIRKKIYDLKKGLMQKLLTGKIRVKA
jgi:type I restriction enzyme S subunit